MSTHSSEDSRYSNQYERAMTTKRGLEIFIRSVKPEDAPLMEAFFKTLSDQAIYNRFFTRLKSMESKMLSEFTQIDYDRDTVLVAFDKSQPEEKILGVARIVAYPGTVNGEFAVTVGDPWQGKGIAGALMEMLIEIAYDREMGVLWAPILAENTHMLNLARNLGSDISWNPDTKWYDLNIRLK